VARRHDGIVGEARPTWTFPSGAKIVFGYLAEHNVQRYLGSQWHAIFLDECTEIDPTAARELRTRLRRVKGDTIPLRFRVSTNPGGTHHAWWKKHYVDRGLLVRSFMSDNPGLDADEYRITLREATTASRFAQLADGDWDSVAHEGASWDPKDIIFVPAPDPSRIMRYVVGVDTSASASETADECGILLGAELLDGTLVVLEDHSHRARPAAWSAAVSDLSAVHGRCGRRGQPLRRGASQRAVRGGWGDAGPGARVGVEAVAACGDGDQVPPRRGGVRRGAAGRAAGRADGDMGAAVVGCAASWWVA
jgi:phage terminase large subunit-like protein